MSDDTVRWIFGSAWRVVGTYLIISVTAEAIVRIVKAFVPPAIKPEVHIHTAPISVGSAVAEKAIADILAAHLAKQRH